MTQTAAPTIATTTAQVLRAHGQLVGLVRTSAIVRSCAAPSDPGATATLEQVDAALADLVAAGQATVYGRSGWQWGAAAKTFPDLYLAVYPSGDYLATALHAGYAPQVCRDLPAGTYSGHYTARRLVNAPVHITADAQGGHLLRLPCEHCPPAWDTMCRPVHRHGCWRR